MTRPPSARWCIRTILNLVTDAQRLACTPDGDGRYALEDPVRRIEGGWRWLSVWGIVEFDDDGEGRRPVAMTGASRDITANKQAEMFSQAQKESLELVVRGAPLADVLAYLTRVVERQSDDQVVASILFLDDEGRLRNGAAPSLPADYLQAIDGLKADPQVGTCAAAAATCLYGHYLRHRHRPGLGRSVASSARPWPSRGVESADPRPRRTRPRHVRHVLQIVPRSYGS